MRFSYIWTICVVALTVASVFTEDLPCINYEEGKMTAICQPNKAVELIAEFDKEFSFTVGYEENKPIKGSMKVKFEVDVGCKFTIIKRYDEYSKKASFYVPISEDQESPSAISVIVKGNESALELVDSRGDSPLFDPKCKLNFTTKDGKHLLKFNVTFTGVDKNLIIKLNDNAMFVKEKVTTPPPVSEFRPAPTTESESSNLWAIIGGSVGGSILFLLIIGGIISSLYVPSLRRRLPFKHFLKGRRSKSHRKKASTASVETAKKDASKTSSSVQKTIKQLESEGLSNKVDMKQVICLNPDCCIMFDKNFTTLSAEARAGYSSQHLEEYIAYHFAMKRGDAWKMADDNQKRELYEYGKKVDSCPGGGCRPGQFCPICKSFLNEKIYAIERKIIKKEYDRLKKEQPEKYGKEITFGEEQVKPQPLDASKVDSVNQPEESVNTWDSTRQT